jgi:hypothetical protein
LPWRHKPNMVAAMIRGANFPLVLLLLAVPAAAQKQSVGVYGLWGAFRDSGHCYAISRPQRRPAAGAGAAFASVGWWPGRGIRGEIHIRFSRPKREGSAVLLRIDDRLFQLIGGGDNGWAPAPAADAEIVAAMRTGIDMSVETRSVTGGTLRDFYPLRGAATAIDAAAIACA